MGRPVPSKNAAHVWLARPDHPPEEFPECYESILDDAERRRMQHFHHVADRETYLLAHGLLRTSLSRCLPEVSPAEWIFGSGRRGRPELSGPFARTGLRFNISHTTGLVGCVVTHVLPCGLDVETVPPHSRLALVVDAVLAPAENAVLATAPPAARTRQFFRYWTLKEAYTKALGLGLAVPFERYAFEGDGDRIRLVSSEVAPDAGSWQFTQWALGPSHLVAVAVRRGSGPLLPVVSHPT